jgi:tRNA threonylcarbamoyladenosine biosynthesis protein TsaE
VNALALRSRSPEETERLGAGLGAALRVGDVLVLDGELGAGKTCLVRGIVAGAAGDPAAVRSPTFVLHQPHRGASVTVHHLDLYRLGRGASIDVLDLDTLLGSGAAVIEWGNYADLGRYDPTTVSISGGEQRHTDRVLVMSSAPNSRLANAWAALAAQTAAP